VEQSQARQLDVDGRYNLSLSQRNWGPLSSELGTNKIVRNKFRLFPLLSAAAGCGVWGLEFRLQGVGFEF